MPVSGKGPNPIKKIRKAAASAGEAVAGITDAAGKAVGNLADKAGDAAKVVADGAGSAANAVKAGVEKGISKVGESRKKGKLNFETLDSLQSVVNVVNDAAMALNDKSRTIKESAIPEVVAGALGAGAGGAISFAALYGLGTAGLSGAGITSGLAAVGSFVGGGMVAGVFALAVPVAAFAAAGVGVVSHHKNRQLRQEKERLYKEALAKHQAIISALKKESDASAERIEYLRSLNILLERALADLKSDLVA